MFNQRGCLLLSRLPVHSPCRRSRSLDPIASYSAKRHAKLENTQHSKRRQDAGRSNNTNGTLKDSQLSPLGGCPISLGQETQEWWFAYAQAYAMAKPVRLYDKRFKPELIHSKHHGLLSFLPGVMEMTRIGRQTQRRKNDGVQLL